MPWDRRRLFTLAGGAGLVALTGAAAGCGSGSGGFGLGDESGGGSGSGGWGTRESATCVPRSALERHTTLADLPLVYEVNQRRSPFWFDGGFHTQLTAWFTRFTETSGIAAPDQIWTYGSWTDGGERCDSWHDAGRAFDLARLRRSGRTLVSCRYDQWRNAADLVSQRRRYWALAASLHHDFAYVLTYLYNAQHHNHIHVDNGSSGDGLSTFRSRSQAQVQAVQAMLTYLWELPVEFTGSWDLATRRASRTALDRIGVADDLDGSADAWRAFLTAGAGLYDGD